LEGLVRTFRRPLFYQYKNISNKVRSYTNVFGLVVKQLFLVK